MIILVIFGWEDLIIIGWSPYSIFIRAAIFTIKGWYNRIVCLLSYIVSKFGSACLAARTLLTLPRIFYWEYEVMIKRYPSILSRFGFPIIGNWSYSSAS